MFLRDIPLIRTTCFSSQTEAVQIEINSIEINRAPMAAGANELFSTSERCKCSWPSAAFESQDVHVFCQMLAKKSPGSFLADLNEELDKYAKQAYYNGNQYLKGAGNQTGHKPVQNGPAKLTPSLFQITGRALFEKVSELKSHVQAIFEKKMFEESLDYGHDPEKVLEIKGKKKKDVYYHSAFINGGNCDCPILFAGDDRMGKQKRTIPAEGTVEGMRLEQYMKETFLTEQSWYNSFTGCFHLLMNRYTFAKDHSIHLHSDEKPFYYEPRDPITSFSCVHGSVLVIAIVTAGKSKRKFALAVYQPPGSVLVMGGSFQQQFQHGVLSWSEMKEAVRLGQNFKWSQDPAFELIWSTGSWDQCVAEVERLAKLEKEVGELDEKYARWNMTIGSQPS